MAELGDDFFARLFGPVPAPTVDAREPAHTDAAPPVGIGLGTGLGLPPAKPADLLAFLVRVEESVGLELGTWAITGKGTLARPCRPLVFPTRDVEKVRALAGRAAAALQQTSCGVDGITVLAKDGRLRAGITRSPDGMRWATLGWTDGSGLATVPVAAIESFERVLAEAERELTELGLVAFRAVCRPDNARVGSYAETCGSTAL